MSTLGSLVSLVAGISGRGPGPSWLWMLIAYLALAFGLGYEWYKASRQVKNLEPSVGRFQKVLREQCDAIILDWEELSSQYLNAPKGEHEPKTLPDPMAAWWVSSEWKVWPYRVGRLQDDFFAFARTFAQRALCAAAMRSLAAADRRCFARVPNLDDRRECPVILLRAAITSSSCRSSPSARLRSCFNCSSTAPSSVIYQLPLLGIQSLLSRIPDLLAYVVVNAPLRALQFWTSKPINVCRGTRATGNTVGFFA